MPPAPDERVANSASWFVSPGAVRTFATFFAVFALWALATPLFAAPDEPAHMIRGASIVRGQLDGERTGPQTFTVDVPSVLTPGPVCFAFEPDVPADCQELAPDTGLVRAASRSHDNPPLFHLLTGWPTLLTGGELSLYLMRLANAIACAGLLTLSVHNIRRLKVPGPVAAGLAVALTPMVLFLGGPVNPSGLATTAALGLWTSALVLIDGATGRSAARAVTACAVPFWILMLVRRDSLLWGTAIVVLLLFVAGSKRIKELAQLRPVWAWSAASLAGAATMYHFSVRGNVTKFLRIADAAGGGSTSEAANALDAYLDQIIGHMGWLDTRVPNLVYQFWTVALVAGLVATLVLASRRFSATVLLGLATIVGIALAVGSIRFPYLQGRYVLPFAVGLPLVAGYGIAKTKRITFPAWLVGPAIVAFTAMHTAAFTQSLRRYTVGHSGDWNFLFSPDWAPPLPPWLLLGGYLMAVGTLYTTLGAMAVSPKPKPVDKAEPQPQRVREPLVVRPTAALPPLVKTPEPAVVHLRRLD